jgi:hypothetical protein
VSEALGLALASTTGFQTNFANLSTSGFVQTIAGSTGVNENVIAGFVDNWIAFYSGPGAAAHSGLTITQAAYGAAFGVALLNPTSANLETMFSSTPPRFIVGLVANALIDNAEGIYQVGVPLGAESPHTPLQGEVGAGTSVIGISTTQIGHFL